MDLVGREVELASAQRALDAVPGGESRVLAVLGEAGIGKSALLETIGARAQPLLVAAGRAAEHERDLPFALALDALQRLLFDDVQWTDDASLEVILHLLTRPPEVPHLLVFALRPTPIASRLLDAARQRAGFEQFTLRPLDDAAARAMLGDAPDPERAICDAGGNRSFSAYWHAPRPSRRSTPGRFPRRCGPRSRVRSRRSASRRACCWPAPRSRELRALGTRISANGRRSERGELSEREREIAGLVAGGQSNKQVAATLYLSEKTIENALTRVYAKLGVRTRAQLARGWAN
jgi:DNA-binding CsgD family transcriptional regulator